jgi:hypothetical protein
MQPLIGLLVHDGTPARNIFDPTASADGLNEKWIRLRDQFRSTGWELLTEDEIGDRAPDFELHVNVRDATRSARAFAVLSECGFVHPSNANLTLLRQYSGVFSWNTDLVDSGLATKIQLSHPMVQGPSNGYRGRDLLIVLISANKALPKRNPDFDLYAERVRAIRWFERHAPSDFALYGFGWDKSARQPSRLGGVIHRLEGLLPFHPRWFPSWRGALEAKRDVLKRARFSIVYENVRGLRGYITEKIFDAFCAGNVPVYWGAEDVEDYIPEDCFIDRRAFSTYGDLYEFLREMPEKQYLNYQRRIRDFLTSEAAEDFSVERFAKVIVSEVQARMVSKE